MNDRRENAEAKPKLFRPGSADYLAWRAEREQVAKPWREALEPMSREKLIGLGVAGARTVKLLEQQVEELTAQLSRYQQDRRKGGQLRRPEQKLAKQAIHQEWLNAKRARREFLATRFAWEMVGKYSPEIRNVETVIKWCRKWAKEADATFPTEGASVAKSRHSGPPEIHRLLGYIDPDWAKQA